MRILEFKFTAANLTFLFYLFFVHLVHTQSPGSIQRAIFFLHSQSASPVPNDKRIGTVATRPRLCRPNSWSWYKSVESQPQVGSYLR